MHVSEVLRSRYSVRGYLPDPVPDGLIREIFDTARLAASGTNTQPWHITVVSGDARDRLRDALCANFDDGVDPGRAFPSSPEMGSPYIDRRRACGYSYYATLGVERDDRPGRAAVARKNHEFFDAPHVAFFSMPGSFQFPQALDVGIMVQTVMLLMFEHGLGCIAQGSLASYPETIKSIVPIPEGNEVLCGMSFGYEDPDAQINTARMPRADLDEVVTFVK